MKRYLFIFILLATTMIINAQNVGDDASDFTFTDSNGIEYSLSQFKGNVVLLFTFGNTCPSCIAVGPNVQTIFADFSGQGLVALGVDFWDGSSSVTTVKSFISMTGIKFPMLLKAGSLSNIYGTTYDRLIVVDQEMKIAFKGTRLAVNDLSGARDVISNLLQSTAVASEASAESFGLAQNYPNPFNPTTAISYQLSAVSKVRLEVFDLLGHSIQVLVDEVQSAGAHRVIFESKGLSGGAYFYRLNAGGNVLTRKMTVVR